MKELPNLDNRYHYNLLNEQVKPLYRFFLERILNREYLFLYVFKYTPEQYPKALWELPYFEVFGINCYFNLHMVYLCVIYDFPELYYVSRPSIKFSPECSVLCDISPFGGGVTYTDRELSEYDRLLDDFYHRFDGCKTGFELELAVHDYIIESSDYANECLDISDEDFSKDSRHEREFCEAFTLLGPLLRGRGVCCAFSQLAQYVFLRRGMRCVLLQTTPYRILGKDDEKGHAWLAVEIEGDFYHLDITFDEANTKNRAIPKYKNFNVTDRERVKIYPEYMNESYPGIICRARKHNYYYHMGLYFKSYEEVLSGFLRFAADYKERGCTEEVVYSFRVSGRLSNKRVLAALSHGRDQSGIEDCSYSKDGNYYNVFLKGTEG